LGFSFKRRRSMFRNRTTANTMFRVVPRQRSTRVRRGFARPFLEALEDRWAPATHVWSGLGTNALWSTPQNWSSGGVPGLNEPNLILQFPLFGHQSGGENNIVGLRD